MTRVALLLPPSLLLESPAYSHPRALALVGPAVWHVFHIRRWSCVFFSCRSQCKGHLRETFSDFQESSFSVTTPDSYHHITLLYIFTTLFFFGGGGLCLLECKLHKGRYFICFVHYHIFSAQLLAYTRHSINCCCCSFTKCV